MYSTFAVISNNLPLRLRVLIPSVENSISDDSMRPGDVLMTRNGLSVEIKNTDAEGRLILADALSEADSESPALLLDFATLTGASRIALGPDIPVFFTNNKEISEFILGYNKEMSWPLPLWKPYERYLHSKVADITNCSAHSPHAGAIVAALYLNKFVEKAKAWVHYDIYAWSDESSKGIDSGANIPCVGTCYNLIERLFIK